MAKDNKNTAKYYEGIGRRKTSTARVRIYKGKKDNMVNDKKLEEYFTIPKQIRDILSPLKLTELEEKYYFTAKTEGGGITGQSGSVMLGLARALVKMNEEFKSVLKKDGLLTRDPRMVERKKYHHRKARKKPQFSKR